MKWFQLSEFDSPDMPGSGNQMDAQFLEILDDMREAAGVPFRITSGFRTQSHNIEVGGKPSSAHLRGLAADINAPNSQVMFLILKTAFNKQIKRIGIGKTFVHVDIDENLPNPCVWTY